MAELQNPDPLVEAVAKARAKVSQRPDIKFPLGTLNIINGHVYAYSGELAGVADTESTMLQFTTNADAIFANVQFNYPRDNNDDATYLIYFNDTLIQRWVCTGSLNPHQPQNLVPLIIPPFTKVHIMAYTASTARYQIVSLTGKVI